MLKRAIRISGFLMAAALIVTPAQAQGFEASVFGGSTTSEGIEATETRVIGGVAYNNLDIVSGGSWGFTAGGFVTPNVELEFLWSRQFSSFEANGPSSKIKLADVSVDNFHGNFVYNWGESGAPLRPFFFGGLGATHYDPGSPNTTLPIVNPLASGTVQSATKFSSTWGAGVKYYIHNIGAKAMLRWTPTYIKSDAGGLWCDPYYPTCWVVGNPDYSQQFEFSGGVTVRFGGF
jgi:hypothetical protein